MNRARLHIKTLSIFLAALFLLSTLPTASAQGQGVDRTKALVAGPRVICDANSSDEGDDAEEIVYLDENGVIVVLDAYQTKNNGANTPIDWRSPEGGWRDFDLGDFNNDGEVEIVAVGGEETTGKIVIYDPVVASNPTANDSKTDNDIPYRQLYRADIPTGRPSLVKTGNFDIFFPTDEILYVVELNDASKTDEDHITRVTVLSPANQEMDGTVWNEHISNKNFNHKWEHVASGDIDREGTDEVILIDADDGKLFTYRPDDDFDEWWVPENNSGSPKWNAAAIGQVYEDGFGEMVAARRTGTFPSLFIWEYDEGDDRMKEKNTDDEIFFNPFPRFIFLADINNSDDDEIFFLRRDAEPRLVVRNRGNDGILDEDEIEANLDDDDGYGVGVGANVDGDGRDEVIIMRDNNIRIYTQLHNSVAPNTINNYGVPPTNERTLRGDLDRCGFVAGPQLALVNSLNEPIEKIEESLIIKTGSSLNITLKNTTTNDSIFFRVSSSLPVWLAVTPSQGNVNSQGLRLTLQFNAADLSIGVYNTTLEISADDALNTPLLLPIQLKVEPAVVTVNPTGISAIYFPCTPPTNAATEPMTKTLAIGGQPNGVRYTAAILSSPDVAAAAKALGGPMRRGQIDNAGNLILSDSVGNRATIALPQRAERNTQASELDWPIAPDWVTQASSASGVTPDTLTVTVDPSVLGANFSVEKAVLVVLADASTGNNIVSIPVTAMCAQERLQLPVILR